MPRSHPPSLIVLARRALVEECAVRPGERLLVAVSGGPDSSALLHVLCRLRKELGLILHAHGVDHGLRPEAARELDGIAALADQWKVPFSTTTMSVPPGGNLQARARTARFTALRSAAAGAGCTRIGTGHHADDRAETVLLRLLRGAGPDGLAVLPPSDPDLMRPLVRATRSDIQRHLTRHSIPFAEDPSNLDRRYQRARLRSELMPLLRELSPGIVGHLTALADALASGPAPQLLDEDGRRVPLKRAHIVAIRRALASRNPGAVVRLSSGRSVRVDGPRGALWVEGPNEAGRQGGQGDRAGGKGVDVFAKESAPRKTELRAPRTSRGAKPLKSG
jgi:tRNA(Ile)-lysidine synthase